MNPIKKLDAAARRRVFYTLRAGFFMIFILLGVLNIYISSGADAYEIALHRAYGHSMLRDVCGMLNIVWIAGFVAAYAENDISLFKN